MNQNFFDLPVYQHDQAAAADSTNIRNLVEYERYCRDRGLYDQMKDCYSDDSIISVTWFTGPGKEFVERSKKTGVGVKHKINNTVVWLNGNKGIAELQCEMHSVRTVINGTEIEKISYARLLYRVQKEDGVWRIMGFDPIYEKDFILPVLPTANFHMDESLVKESRPSYKCLNYILRLQGLPCNQELPGDDRPETVEKLYKEASEWIFS